jgi:hypothetical protein
MCTVTRNSLLQSASLSCHAQVTVSINCGTKSKGRAYTQCVLRLLKIQVHDLFIAEWGHMFGVKVLCDGS